MSKLLVSSLDFENIKAALIAFIKDKPEFNSVDFNGANINLLLDVLSQNTYYQGLAANFALNEMFLETASKRASILSHAKSLGYTPYSNTAAKANVRLIIDATGSSAQEFTLPVGCKFIGVSDTDSYWFTTTEAHTVQRSGNQFILDTSISQGTYVAEQFVFDQTTRKIKLNNINADTSTLSVIERVTGGSGYNVYSRVTKFLEVTPHTQAFYVYEAFDGTTEVHFGDGVLGKMPTNGNVLDISYLTTNGEVGNGIKSFTLSTDIGFTGLVSVTTLDAAFGGRNKETDKSIKQNALNYFGSQNRAVVASDYKSLILQHINAKAALVWGGEDHVPPKYGKIMICVMPNYGYTLTTAEKNEIVSMLKPKAVANVQFEFFDPYYIDILVETNVNYTNKRLDSIALLKTRVINATTTYNEDQLSTFSATFRQSSLMRYIDKSDTAILGSSVKTSLIKEYSPLLHESYPINFSFGSKLVVGESFLSSSYFSMVGSLNKVRFKETTGNQVSLVSLINGIEYVVVKSAGTIVHETGDISLYPIIITDYEGDFLEFYVNTADTSFISNKNTIYRIQNKNVKVTTIAED